MKFLSVFAMGLCIFSLSGCGEAPPSYVEELVPFTGKVTLEGKPLADATVTFMSRSGESRYTAGVTGPDGVYRLASDKGFEGAIPGEYDVVISKFVTQDGSVPPPDVPPMDVGAEEMVPAKYSSYANVTLSATIPEKGGEQNFDL